MKKLMILFCLLCLIFSMSSVCASDDSNNIIQANEDNLISASNSNMDLLSSENDNLTISEEVVLTNNSNVINVGDVTKYFSGSERFNVSLRDDAGNPISNKTVDILINGVTYPKVTNENGSASIALKLSSGEYPVVVSYNNYSSVANVNILPTVSGMDITKMFKNETQYYATFKDTDGTYLANGTKISFNINGVFYNRTVGSEGKAKLNINLAPNDYIITAINPSTGEKFSNNITVRPPLVENKNIVKYFKNDTQYLVKVIGSDGNLVGAGSTVTFNINGVFYNRTTNSSSIAKLNINLAPGNHVITSEYNGYKVSNTIKVLNILSANNLNKLYGTSNQFVTNLLDGEGKLYPNQNVTFNINGVFYNRTTDSNGSAKLNINLRPGVYIITSMFNGGAISNQVEVKPITISVGDVLSGAGNLLSYYNSKGALPSTVKSPVNTYTLPEFFYLMNKAISQIGSSNGNNINIIYGLNVSKASSANTVYSCLIKKDEYVSIANDLVNKINSAKQVPNTVTTKEGVVKYEDYAVICSRILNFYSDYNGDLANYVTFVSNNPPSDIDKGTNNINPYGINGKKVFIDADGGSDAKKWDLARALTAAGWEVTVGKTFSNAHYEDYFNVPSNHVLITLYNGFCAGTIRELASSGIQNLLKAKNVVCVPIWDTTNWVNPNGMGPYRYGDFSGYSASRAWDDNFSTTDPSISNVAQYLAANNIKYCAYPTTDGIMYQFLNGGYFATMSR